MANAIPNDLPSGAAEAARDTLGGAVAAADELPDRVGAELLVAAREAFTHGMQLTAITSATLTLGMAILAVALLRHARTGSEREGQPSPEPKATIPGSSPIGAGLDPAAPAPENRAPGIEEP